MFALLNDDNIVVDCVSYDDLKNNLLFFNNRKLVQLQPHHGMISYGYKYQNDIFLEQEQKWILQ